MHQADQSGIDFREEIPFLIGVISSDNDFAILELARSRLLGFAYDRILQNNPLFSDLFRPAQPVFERHLEEAETDENSVWGAAIISLTTFVGLQPSSQRVLALIYRMVDDKDERRQGAALIALARLKPLPSEAKRVLISRTAKTEGKTSGPEVLEILGFAIADLDLLRILLKSAAGNDVLGQRAAVRALSRADPMPKEVLDLFRRLLQRKDLDENVAPTVKDALRALPR
jgi:hypothetical protein